MTNVIVRRKRARMLLEIMNGRTEVESRNIRIAKFYESPGKILCVVYYRGVSAPIASIRLGDATEFTVEEIKDHPYANTEATRYQIKQLRAAVDELRQAKERQHAISTNS